MAFPLIPIGFAAYNGYKSYQAASNGDMRGAAIHAVGVVTSGAGAAIALAGAVPRAAMAIRAVSSQAPGAGPVIAGWMQSSPGNNRGQ